MREIDKVVKALERYDKFVITSHVNLEGDSLGSQLAIANLLRAMGKEFVIYDHDKVPDIYHFLPQAHIVQNRVSEKPARFGSAIVLDCPNITRVGKVREFVEKVGHIINIDHHVSNERFGDLNWIEKDTSSVGEMIYKLFRRCNMRITREAALYLYIAILTDTGSFNYSNTTSATHMIVSELLEYGIEPQDISKRIYENKTIEQTKLLGKALSSIRIAEGGRVAYIVVRNRMMQDLGTTPEACENFINFARSIRGIDIAVFFREDHRRKNIYNVSFRSTDDVDVNKIASTFGGGGHKGASGCTIRGNLSEVKRKVLARVRDEL